MLTSKGRYAVMAMVDLALESENKKPISLAEIARRQDITVPYLEQIFSRLKQAGLVNSVRGPGGGYRLAQDADAITIADVVAAVEESIRMTRCGTANSKKKNDNMNGIKGKANSNAGCMQHGVRCITHDLWRGLGDHIKDYLSSITLMDVCHSPEKSPEIYMIADDGSKKNIGLV